MSPDCAVLQRASADHTWYTSSYKTFGAKPACNQLHPQLLADKTAILSAVVLHHYTCLQKPNLRLCIDALTVGGAQCH
jgi:hypothetical protein